MNDAEWLKGLKVGDEVAIPERFTHPTEYRLSKIDRVTPTQVIIGALRFRKKDGHMVGGDQWDFTHITRITPAIREAAQRKNVIARFNATRDRLRDIPTSRIEAALALLTSGEDEQR